MTHWKTDPLYRGIFDEIRAFWGALDSSDRPELIRVEEWAPVSSRQPASNARLREVWLLDDDGPRSVALLRREPHDPGPARGRFFRFGLVRFGIEPDRRHVHLICQLGPEIGGEVLFGVVADGDHLHLEASTGSLTA